MLTSGVCAFFVAAVAAAAVAVAHEVNLRTDGRTPDTIVRAHHFVSNAALKCLSTVQ